jgi:tetratricopeptide (TPR) repeat protein
MRRLAPEGPGTIDDLVIDLLAGEACDVAWLDLVRHDDGAGAPGWVNAWTRVLMRLNERREALRRRFPTGGIVLVTTRDRMLRTPETAPDLWSIRAWALVLRRVHPVVHPTDFREIPLIVHPREHAVTDVDLARQAVTQARVDGGPQRLLAALLSLSWAEQEDAARVALREAEEILDTLDVSRDSVRAVGWVAWRHYELGEFGAAEARFHHMITAAREQGYMPELAWGLHDLGILLGRQGRVSEALDTMREPVAIWRSLTRIDGNEYLPSLARSGFALSMTLGKLGRFEESLDVAYEALSLARMLAAQQPDRHLGQVAEILDVVGVALIALARHDESIIAAREATALHRELAAARPREFASSLATSLSRLAVALAYAAHWEEALSTVGELMALLQQTTEVRHWALGDALGTVGALLSSAGQPESGGAVLADALRMLLKHEPPRPVALERAIHQLAGEYHRACAAAGREPAEDLAPILVSLSH